MPSEPSPSRSVAITCTARRLPSRTPRFSTRCAATASPCAAAPRRLSSLCDRYGFAYYGDWARALLGWALGQEQRAEGAVMIESALERLDRQRAQARRPYYLSLLADTYNRLGDRARATSIVDAATAMALDRGDRGGFPRCTSSRASSSQPRSASRRSGARSRWPASRTAAPSSVGFSHLRLRASSGKRCRLPDPPGNRRLDGTVSRTFPERLAS